MALDLQSVLDALLDGVVVLDGEGRVELVNAEACRILETSAEATLNEPIERTLGAEHFVTKLARAVLDSGRAAIERERPFAHRFDEDVMVDVAASPRVDEEQKPSGVVLVLRDRTIQNNLQEFISERERLSTFGRIAAGIAHEVKNPLGGIRGAAEIVASRASEAKMRDAAELIVRETDRITMLVDDLMVFANGGDLRFVAVNIHRILDDVLDLLTMDPIASGVEVKRIFDPSIPELPGDGDRLTQVFLNLAKNAVQAMEGKGGTLSITTRMLLDHRLGTPTGDHPPTVLVEVADSGPGIPPELLEHLATPLFTTRPGGTGLGLAVARHWVARHGGTLRIDSTPGAGATVRVALPLRRAS